jgi:hypothetical protein
MRRQMFTLGLVVSVISSTPFAQAPQEPHETISRDVYFKIRSEAASAVYHLAMRDEKLPRFSKDQMPALPGTNPTQ